MLTIGIDIGGTKIAGGLVDQNGSIIEQHKVDTPPGTRALTTSVIELIQLLSARHGVVAIGVAAAGFVDQKRATVIYAPNIAWRDYPLKAAIAAATHLPVVIENDANAAGWAEFCFGAGRGIQDMVMITMGTGIGGAVVTNGHLYRGGHGVAAELGHVRFIRNGLPCGCGQNGCIEQYASGRALQRQANELADAGGIGNELARVRAERGEIRGVDLSNLVRANDPGAIEALRRVATALGEACGSFQATLDPELFVIGGGLAQLGETLLHPVRAAYEIALPGAGHRRAANFVIADLGNDAGLIGAATFAGQRA